jgi:nucleotide-binding universal stress UspA family protein
VTGSTDATHWGGQRQQFELGTDGPNRILVGVDGSDTSLRAGAYAAGLARRQNAKIVVVHVVNTTLASSVAAAAAAAAMQAQEEMRKEVRRLVAEGRAHMGMHADLVERTGNPYKEIVAVADELKVDAIVVGASTQAGHRLVGSLATRLVRDARWPVTVVP